MITLDMYKQWYGSPVTEGQARKLQSDMIMEATWDRDIQSQTCYLYDYYHDDEPDKIRDLHPQFSTVKIPIDTKYIVNAYQSDDKDQVSYHIQFRPSQECNVDYYNEVFAERYDSLFPMGLYIDIPDEKGKYNRWLVTEKANYYNPQFITWSVLPCDYRFQWIFENQKYQMWGVLRSQNSYNSGIWSDYKFTSPEDQQKFIVPLNRDSEKLYHNQRMIVDARVETEPIAWVISKIKRFSPNGLVRITMAQDKFDQNHDYIERDNSGKIVGMWADYYNSNIELQPTSFDKITTLTAQITYSGLKPELKVGGSYKTFTMSYYDSNNEEILNQNYDWKFKIDDNELIDYSLLLKILDSSNTASLSKNQIKVKFIGNDDYLGSVLTIYNDFAELKVKIVGM